MYSFWILFGGVAAAGILVVLVAYLLLRGDIQQYFRWKNLEYQKEARSALQPLKLQAYERLILFIERIHPPQLFLRLHEQGIGLHQFQSVLLQEIRAEYQHNVTQQLYVSDRAWKVVKKLTEDTIAMVNNVAQGLPEDSTGLALSQKILQHLATLENDPYQLTLDLIKNDIHQLH